MWQLLAVNTHMIVLQFVHSLEMLEHLQRGQQPIISVSIVCRGSVPYSYISSIISQSTREGPRKIDVSLEMLEHIKDSALMSTCSQQFYARQFVSSQAGQLEEYFMHIVY